MRSRSSAQALDASGRAPPLRLSLERLAVARAVRLNRSVCSRIEATRSTGDTASSGSSIDANETSTLRE